MAAESSPIWRASARTPGSNRTTSAECGTVGRPTDGYQDPALIDTVTSGGLGGGLEIHQLAVGVAAHTKDRVHDGRVGHAVPVQQHRDRIHQHRRLLGDDLQGRA